jgi:oxalate decarboxylase/phosphoglucose isomerase-like protein (cupin superfamily)
MLTWTFLRLFADDNGVSRVDPASTQELAEVDYAPPAPPMFVGRASDAQALVIVELPVGWQGGWHPSPREQWVIGLAGEMGYEAGDGTRFNLRSGDCILTTDTRGRGHNSWNAGTGPLRLALIQVR